MRERRGKLCPRIAACLSALFAMHTSPPQARGEGQTSGRLVLEDARREVWLLSETTCPTKGVIAELLQPLVPGVIVRSAVASTPDATNRPRSVHRVQWDDRGLIVDGTLVKARTNEPCQKLAEDWAVVLALLIAEEPRHFVDAPSSGASEVGESRRGPSQRPAVRRSVVQLGATFGAAFAVAPSGEVRPFGAVDVSLLLGMWGIGLGAGVTGEGEIALERAGFMETSAARVRHEEAWVSASLLVNQTNGRLRLFGGIGGRLAWDQVEGAGLPVTMSTSAFQFGLDGTLGLGVPVGGPWAIRVPLGITVFPSETTLEVRNVTSGADVRLSALPRFVPRIGVGISASF